MSDIFLVLAWFFYALMLACKIVELFGAADKDLRLARFDELEAKSYARPIESIAVEDQRITSVRP